MGLFSRKKRPENELEIPSAPPELESPEEEIKFPEMPEEEIKAPEIAETPEKEMLGVVGEVIEKPSKPLFIDISDFKDILEEIGLIRTILKEADDSAARVEDFTNDEDKEFRRWNSLVSDVQKKLIYCEKTLFR